ncbi:unnamed protein product [Victoria cruziana]
MLENPSHLQTGVVREHVSLLVTPCAFETFLIPFRVTPQPGVPPEEAGAAVAAESSTGTSEEMIKRAVCARELGVPIVMHDYLIGGFTANTSLAHYCRDNGLLLHIHRTMHAVIDRQRNHGIHFRVLVKVLCMSGGDHIHSGTIVDWVSMPGVLPVASGGLHVWHMLALIEIFGDDFVLQFGGGTLGHPWGNAPGVVANRVALEACVQARNEGRDLAREGNYS